MCCCVKASSASVCTIGSDVTAPQQAHAWVALGKLCLVDEALAKKCVPMFVLELGRASAPAVGPARNMLISNSSISGNEFIKLKDSTSERNIFFPFLVGVGVSYNSKRPAMWGVFISSDYTGRTPCSWVF